MTDPAFRSRTRPTLAPRAQALVTAYDQTYGSCAPGCCPEALAAVLDLLTEFPAPLELLAYPSRVRAHHIAELAAELRGENP